MYIFFLSSWSFVDTASLQGRHSHYVVVLWVCKFPQETQYADKTNLAWLLLQLLTGQKCFWEWILFAEVFYRENGGDLDH